MGEVAIGMTIFTLLPFVAMCLLGALMCGAHITVVQALILITVACSHSQAAVFAVLRMVFSCQRGFYYCLLQHSCCCVMLLQMSFADTAC